MRRLEELVRRAARTTPNALAVHDAEGETTYASLDRFADEIGEQLTRIGVSRGDRVGIWLDKSARAIAAMQATLRLGAAYVPLDPAAPIDRILTITEDAGFAAIVTSKTRAERLNAPQASATAVLIVETSRGTDPDGSPGAPCLDFESREPQCPRATPVSQPAAHAAGTPLGPIGLSNAVGLGDAVAPSDSIGTVDSVRASGSVDPVDEMAYILYTSGSTGVPKGVCISHRNAQAFIEWAFETLGAVPDDRFANHAPFHFDLSVLDLYVAFRAGASVHLVPDGIAYAPTRLVEFIERRAISVWYSVPSALMLMMDQGKLLESSGVRWRAVLFAGEVFPIRHLRSLRERYASTRFLNLYGPTETNVCTYYEVTEIDPMQVEPMPIGKACSGDHVFALRPDGTPAGVGEEGELFVTGPTVCLGYFGKPPQGDAPYATGDIVRLSSDGNYVYVARRDHMVKVRGHRIELGEIEAALLASDAIREAGVVVRGTGMSARLRAFIAADADAAPSLLQCKRLCAARLPRYMIVDEVERLDELPRTRNGKLDRKALQALAEGETPSGGRSAGQRGGTAVNPPQPATRARAPEPATPFPPRSDVPRDSGGYRLAD